MQTTIASSVSVSGIGLHTGAQSRLFIHPAQEHSGIVFWRSDLGRDEKAAIAADRVRDTRLCTGLFLQTQTVMTIEHLLSALSGEGIDNAIVEVQGPEIPIFDGSSAAYQVLLAEADKINLNAPRRVIEIIKTIRVEAPDKWAELQPASHFELQFTVDNYNHPYLGGLPKHLTFNSHDGDYWEDIARARTFGFMRDVEFMQEQGLALGGGLSNAMVFDHEKIINAEGMRFNDEIVRHKILDAIGDLYAVGAHIRGRYVGYRAGHALNNQLLRALLEQTACWQWVEEIDDNPIH